MESYALIVRRPTARSVRLTNCYHITVPAKRLTVRLPGELKHALDAESSTTGRSPSEIVRVALSRHLRKRKLRRRTCLDVAKELGVIGAAKDLPPDLSTNKKYFEGFGES